MQGKKWHEENENLVQGDIVYFKLQESAMSANWRSGKVENVKIGADGCVRQVTISYTDTTADNAEDWTHRTVDRPVRNIVKISHIDETTFMDDINEVHDLAKKVMNQDDVAQNLDRNDVKAEPVAKVVDLDDQEIPDSDDVQHDKLFNDEEPTNVPVPAQKKRKKRRTELENLEITLKGWNLTRSMFQASLFTHSTNQQDKLCLQMKAVDGWLEGFKEVIREGEDEDVTGAADRDFNLIKHDDDFDNIYLL